MPRHVNKPQHDKSTQQELEALRESQEEARRVKTDLLERNAEIISHVKEAGEAAAEMPGKASELPENNQYQYSSSAPHNKRDTQDEQDKKNEKVIADVREFPMADFTRLPQQWLDLSFGMMNLFFSNWNTLLSATPRFNRNPR